MNGQAIPAVVQIIGSLGFPIVAYLLVFKWAQDRDKRFEATLKERDDKLGTILQRLDRTIQTQTVLIARISGQNLGEMLRETGLDGQLR